MGQHDERYIADLRKHAAESRTLYSNAQKVERERMVARAFLRCTGEPFSDDEILTGQPEPVDVAFRTARFQIRDVLGEKKPQKDWRERERRYQNAKSVADVTEPWTHPIPLSLDDAARAVAEGLAEKVSRYGRGCSGLDALVHVNLKGRYLWPLEPALNAEATRILEAQGWRSVSILFVPYGAVLVTQGDAPNFLRDKMGLILNKWPHCDGWFSA